MKRLMLVSFESIFALAVLRDLHASYRRVVVPSPTVAIGTWLAGTKVIAPVVESSGRISAACTSR